jgi:putative metalloprotease
MFEQVVNAQFSQKQEYEADSYAFQFMGRHGYDQRAAITALRKLEKLGSGGGGLIASHPDPGDRAKRMEQMLAGK